MSIIHEALKRQETHEPAVVELVPAPVAPVAGTERAAASAVLAQDSPYMPAILGAAGVVLAATITYLATKPGEITVVVPPSPAEMRVAAASSIPVFEGAMAPPVTNPYAPQNSQPYDPYAVQGYPTQTVPAGMQAPPQMQQSVPPAQQALPQVVSVNPQSSNTIPVITPEIRPANTVSAPGDDLPPDAVTIEIANARLDSMNGDVAVNGMASRPGSPVRVGSEITTGTNGGASLAFNRANMDLAGGSLAKISRLERRTAGNGSPKEDVTVQLKQGMLHTVVNPGEGAVAVATDAFQVSAQNGAFTVKTNADKTVTVVSQGGAVRVVPNDRKGDAYILKPNETFTYSTEKGIVTNPNPAGMQTPAP